MPDTYTPYRFTDDEEVIDPPVIQEYERRLRDAQASGDDAQIAVVQEDYHAERKRVADKHNERVEDRRREDERLLAQDRQRVEQERSESTREQEQRDERSNIERLRAEQEANRQNPPADPNGGNS